MFRKVYVLNKEYPVYDENDAAIGYTSKNDTAIPLTLCDNDAEQSFILISGNFIGYDALVLNNEDMKKALIFKSKHDKKDTIK